jgi:hypothetical protein
VSDALVEKLCDLAITGVVTIFVAAITAAGPFLILWNKHKENAAAIDKHTEQIADATIGVKVLEKVIDVPIIKAATTEATKELVKLTPPPMPHD